MNAPPANGAWCAACRMLKPIEELLRITDLTTGAVRYVCRPTLNGGQCFWSVRDVTQDRIETAAKPRARPTAMPVPGLEAT